MSGLEWLTLEDAASGIRQKRFSAAELTRHCLDRMDRYGETLNCIAGTDPETALADAETADRQLVTGQASGPLHGVPLAHKDMYYRAGRESACGSVIRKGWIPGTTSTALDRLDRAGALDIARLNMVEFALGPTGHNDHTGAVRNPWNRDHITGGSSSGSGSAVAAGLVYGALGSDTGGSIRTPSACCGLVGIKATYGLVSRAGAMPLSHSLDHVGPLTRSVRDCALMLQAIAGHDDKDPTTARRDVPDYLEEIEAGIDGLTIAVCEDFFSDGLDDEVAALNDQSLRVMEKLGARIRPFSFPEMNDLVALTTIISSSESAAYHASSLATNYDSYGRQTRSRMVAGLLYPGVSYQQALKLRAPMLRAFCDAAFGAADVLHAPALAVPVPTIAETDVSDNPGFLAALTNLSSKIRPFNFLGIPTMSVPCGFTANGLPAAFQLAGRPFDEATLFRTARAYERATGCTDNHPALDG
jgi:aspartyl-tRNA(Asn)/glutamyl-tRNA(Gln) amidotransferase subunit A